MQQAPQLTDHVDGIMGFALKLGGDVSIHIAWLASLHERFVGCARKIRGTFLLELATVGVDLPRVKLAFLFLQYSCRRNFVRERYCEWVSCTELPGGGRGLARGRPPPRGAHARLGGGARRDGQVDVRGPA